MNKFKRVYKMPLRVYDEEIEDFYADIIVGMTVFFNAKGQPMKGVLDTNEHIDMVDGKPWPCRPTAVLSGPRRARYSSYPRAYFG